MKKSMIFWGLLPLIISLVACAAGSNNPPTSSRACHHLKGKMTRPREPSPNPAPTTEPENNQTIEDTPPSPPVSEETRQEILGQLYAQEESLNLCDDFMDRDYSQNSSQVFALDQQTYLVQLGCFLAAYQANFEFLIYKQTESGEQFTPLTLTVFNQNESEETIQEEMKNMAGLSTYSPVTRSLNIVSKYRGLGDCGTVADYQLKDGKFELVNYQAKFDCDGNYVDKSEYPRIFP